MVLLDLWQKRSHTGRLTLLGVGAAIAAYEQL